MKASLLLSISLVVACAKPAGGPLAHTFDNTRIAAVPLDQKQPVVQAQQQHDLALLHQSTVTATYRDSEIEQDLAEHQSDRAVVVSQLVASRQPDARPSAPSTESATLARRTAEAKVDFMRARRGWLAKAAEASLFAVYAAQAKLELERARVAQANRVTAADFNLEAYQRQLESREQAAKLAGEASDSERKSAETKLAAWGELERAYLEASSVSGPLESSRFAMEWMVKTPPATPAVEPPATEPAAEPTGAPAP